MGHLAGNYEAGQDFWKPPVATEGQEPLSAEITAEACETCGVNFILGSRYCHLCGADRDKPAPGSTSRIIRESFDFRVLCDVLGQTWPSLTTLILGCACIIAAIVTGFLYSANTLLDWQAIQIWRIEWLLAATAFFVAGILLKNKKK